jgi:hypothetical protein
MSSIWSNTSLFSYAKRTAPAGSSTQRPHQRPSQHLEYPFSVLELGGGGPPFNKEVEVRFHLRIGSRASFNIRCILNAGRFTRWHDSQRLLAIIMPHCQVSHILVYCRDSFDASMAAFRDLQKKLEICLFGVSKAPIWRCNVSFRLDICGNVITRDWNLHRFCKSNNMHS